MRWTKIIEYRNGQEEQPIDLLFCRESSYKPGLDEEKSYENRGYTSNVAVVLTGGKSNAGALSVTMQ